MHTASIQIPHGVPAWPPGPRGQSRPRPHPLPRILPGPAPARPSRRSGRPRPSLAPAPPGPCLPPAATPQQALPSPPASAPAACRRTLALPGIRAPGRTADPLPGATWRGARCSGSATGRHSRRHPHRLRLARPLPSLPVAALPPRSAPTADSSPWPGPAASELSAQEAEEAEAEAGLGRLGGPAQLGCCSPAFFRRLRPPPRPDPPPSGDWERLSRPPASRPRPLPVPRAGGPRRAASGPGRGLLARLPRAPAGKGGADAQRGASSAGLGRAESRREACGSAKAK